MKNSLIIILLTIILLGCSTKKEKQSADTSSLIIYEKLYSKDSSKYLIRFSFDEGSFGSCCNQYSVLKKTDSLKDIKKHILPSVYESPIWISNKEISVDINMIPLLTAKGNFNPSYPELEIEEINNVRLKKNFFNKIEHTDKRIITERLLNPSSEIELVCYEYKPRENLSDSILHISIVPVGKPIPNYGNLYIVQDIIYGKILDIKWLGNKSISFTIPKGEKYYKQIDFCEVEKTTCYPLIVKEIERIIKYNKNGG